MFFDGSVRSIRTIRCSGRHSLSFRSSTSTLCEKASRVVAATSMEIG